MAGENDSDPYERFFRPRPDETDSAAAAESGEPDGDDSAAGAGSGGGASGGRTSGRRGRRARRQRRTPDAPGAAARTAKRPDAATTGVSVAAAASPGIPGATPTSARRYRTFLLVSGAMSALVLVVSGGAWALQDFLLSRVKRVDAFSGLAGRPGGGPKGAVNILVAGVDRREGIPPQALRKLRLGRQEGQRSDTMMLVHLSENHDKATVVSLPRDSLVTIPAHRGADGRPQPEQRNKLNAAFSWGGHKLAIQTIERNTGIRIDHYVEVNFLGFIKVVDALGGVEVCTPTRINDSKSGLTMAPGKHVVDGATALAYVRTRYTLSGGSDIGRVQRQQQFMASMIHRAFSTQTVTDPGKLSAFLNASLAAIRLDEHLSRETVGKLAVQLRNVSTDSVAFTTVPMTNSGQMTKDWGSVALWDGQRASALFSKIKKDQPISQPPARGPATPAPGAGGPGNRTPGGPASSPAPTGPAGLTVPPGRIQVRVLNGTNTSGLGAKAAADLRAAGFGIDGTPTNAPVKGITRTVIQYGAAREDSAKTLRAAIPGARLSASPSLGSRLQVVVGSSWPGAEKVQVQGTVPGQPGQGQAGAGETAEIRTATQNACK